MVTVKNIFDFIDSFAPFESQSNWDNSGLLVGDKSKEVNRIVVCLDLTNDTINKAISAGADLIFSHHPVIFHPIKSVCKGDYVYKLIQNNISVISAHTNLDLANGGVCDVLSNVIGLSDIKPLEETGELSFIRIGKISSFTPQKFAKHVASSLETTVRLASANKTINNVAVCGGSGCSFIPELLEYDIDAFVTGDAKHNDFIDAADNGLTLIAAGHYETENPTMPLLAKLLQKNFKEIEVHYISSEPVEYIS